MQFTKSARCLIVAAGLAAASMTTTASAQTAFTYQGVLEESGSPVTGLESIRFRIYDAQTGGTLIGETTQNVDVADGVFSTQLNFGPLNTIDPATAWLEIGVETSPGTYETLGRQQITSAPFAMNTRGLNVNAGGNVGIGTTNPGRALVVRSNSGPMLGLEGPSNPGLRFASDNSNALGTSWSVFQDNSSGDLIFRDSFDGITRMAIDSVNGRVGIGNTNPAATLDVNGTGTFSSNVGIGTNSPTARLDVAGGGKFASGVPVVGSLAFMTGSGGDVQYDGGNDGDFFIEHTGDVNGSTIFGRTNGQRLLKIQNNGNVGIGVDNPNFPLTIQSDTAGNTIGLRSSAGGSDWHLDFGAGGLQFVESGVASRVVMKDGGGLQVDGGIDVNGRSRFGNLGFSPISATVDIVGQASDTFALVVEDPSGIYRFSVNNNGNVATQCSIICASDERLKDDIVDLESPLDKIMALRDVTFTWKDETLAKRGTQIGFVAQEVQKVLPELIGETPDGMLGVDYASLTSVLTGAVQEQQAEIESMQAQIADLQAEMESLQNQRSMTGASMIWPALIGGGLVGGIALARRRQSNA